MVNNEFKDNDNWRQLGKAIKSLEPVDTSAKPGPCTRVHPASRKKYHLLLSLCEVAA